MTLAKLFDFIARLFGGFSMSDEPKGQPMRHINKIIVHCSDTRPKWMEGKPAHAKVAEIRRWHTEERGWSDIAYHHVIDRDGSVEPGRAAWRVGAHVKGHNKHSIGVCLIGGHGAAADDSFFEHFTEAQMQALADLVRDLSKQYPGAVVSGHQDFAAKACPGFDVKEWWTDL